MTDSNRCLGAVGDTGRESRGDIDSSLTWLGFAQMPGMPKRKLVIGFPAAPKETF